jgi:hypothetical protein
MPEKVSPASASFITGSPASAFRYQGTAGHGLVWYWPAMLFLQIILKENGRRETSKVRMSGVVSAPSSSSQADHFMLENKEE